MGVRSCLTSKSVTPPSPQPRGVSDEEELSPSSKILGPSVLKACALIFVNVGVRQKGILDSGCLESKRKPAFERLSQGLDTQLVR